MPVKFNFLRLLLTLSYSHVFQVGLSLPALFLRQIALASYDIQTPSQIARAVKKLEQLGLVCVQQGLILPARPLTSFDRAENIASSIKTQLWATKMAEAKAVAHQLAQIPWIQAVALTGSIAAGNAKPKDDCDFFIITTPHGLWLTRLLVLLLAKIKGKRRSFANEEPDSWCFNMWLTDNNLILPVNMRSLYTAYELCQAVWLVNKNLTAQRFVGLNAWARRLLPVYYLTAYQATTDPQLSSLPDRKVIFWLCNGLALWVNWLFFLVQYLYMLPHKTSEWVGYTHAFFHPRPTGRLTLDRLQKWLEYYLYSKTEESPKKTSQRVLVTGVFDLMHTKHRQLLLASARLGQLWVGVESDQRVRRLKGWDRPLQPAWWKVMYLNRLPQVRRAFILPSSIDQVATQRQLLAQIRPDILAVSASTPNLIKKKRLMAEIGGRVVVVLPHDRSLSTTQIVQGKSSPK